MKKTFLILVTVLITVCVFAQTPQKMSYQAIIRNANNQLVTNQSVAIKFSILSGSITGTLIYAEKQTLTTNYAGTISAEIGSGTIISGSFSSIDWANGTYFIKTETDPSGGTNYSITGTSQLLSVPYALHAKTAENIAGGGGSGFTHYIGELFGGGIVVSLWKKNGVEHGLIASLTDISTNTPWSNITDKLVGTGAQNLTNGQANTSAIIKQAGHTSSAAKICDDYTSGSYSDWYLPAIWELKECYNAAFFVNEVLGDANGIQADSYWSSTESNIPSQWTDPETQTTKTTYDHAWYLSFPAGGEAWSKDSNHRVRAVRRF